MLACQAEVLGEASSLGALLRSMDQQHLKACDLDQGARPPTRLLPLPPACIGAPGSPGPLIWHKHVSDEEAANTRRKHALKGIAAHAIRQRGSLAPGCYCPWHVT